MEGEAPRRKHPPREALPTILPLTSVMSSSQGAQSPHQRPSRRGQPGVHPGSLLTHDFPVGATSFQSIASSNSSYTNPRLTLHLRPRMPLASHLAQPWGRAYLPQCSLPASSRPGPCIGAHAPLLFHLLICSTNYYAQGVPVK